MQKTKIKKRCYYQVLQVSQTATLAEIKANYRKLALKYHPDKNIEEDTKHKFVEIQEAWKILSDVNERTWYDNNREQILFNKKDMTAQQFELHTFGFNVKEYFSADCFTGFDDDAKGFYSVYRKVFELIKEEEKKAFEFNTHQKNQDDQDQGEFRKYIGFGDSNTKIEDVIKFYSDWESFQTFKTFAWADQYDLREAENRDIRRQMQKENNKERLKERKKYLTTVKELIAIVKKRDPRRQKVAEYLRQQQQYKQEMKKKKQQQDRIRKQQKEKERIRQLEQARLREQALKSEQQKQKERKMWIQPPKIQQKRQKLVKHQCAQCRQIFKDFNKHFQHLQKTGHQKS